MKLLKTITTTTANAVTVIDSLIGATGDIAESVRYGTKTIKDMSEIAYVGKNAELIATKKFYQSEAGKDITTKIVTAKLQERINEQLEDAGLTVKTDDNGVQTFQQSTTDDEAFVVKL